MFSLLHYSRPTPFPTHLIIMTMASSEKYQVEEVSPANSALQPFPIGDFGIPCNWDSDNHTRRSHHEPFTLVKLSEKCWEYTSIETEFGRAGATIMRVDRIENKELWEKFDAESKRMLRTRTGMGESTILVKAIFRHLMNHHHLSVNKNS